MNETSVVSLLVNRQANVGKNECLVEPARKSLVVTRVSLFYSTLIVVLCLFSIGSLFVSFDVINKVEREVDVGADTSSIENMDRMTTSNRVSAPTKRSHRSDDSVPLPAVVVDMISIGSNTRPSLKDVQLRTFARHRSVRHFWRRTEHHDYWDASCPVDLTVQQVEEIAVTCHANSTYPELHPVSQHFASNKFLLRQKNPAGWLCAQKRPLGALHGVVQYYRSGAIPSNTTTSEMAPKNGSRIPLPDYLFVMDDDSWFHMDLVLPTLLRQHAPTSAHVVVGCLIRSQYNMHLSFYWGVTGLSRTSAVADSLPFPARSKRR
jgi:hypothetical protein